MNVRGTEISEEEKEGTHFRFKGVVEVDHWPNLKRGVEKKTKS